MQNSLVWLKIKQRLNKLDSSDYDNIECWQVREAFNKAQLEWVRRQINGDNQQQTGDEETKSRVDDLQILLKTLTLKGLNKKYYFESDTLPKDLMSSKAVTPYVQTECGEIFLDSRQREKANTDLLLKDWSSQPSLEFEQTFHTINGNKINVYTNGNFKVKKIDFTYYRKPLEIDFGNCEHIDGKSGQDIDPEFKDDIVELIIDDTVSILAADIESINQFQITKQRNETNN